MERYFQEEIECMDREKLRELQNERFLKQVQNVWDNVPYYKKKMKENGVSPADIKSVDDISKLPFVTKDDLRETYPYGLFARPLNECVRIHSTSGTTGKRVVAGYTQNDVDIWNDCTARALVAAGASPKDVVQIAYGYGLFTGGLGLDGGSQKLGCLTIPMSSGNTARQLQFMTDLGSTILCCTPSYAAYLCECVEEKGLRDKIKLKAGIFGAEAWSQEMRDSIEEGLGIKAFDIYGLTELSGPGVAYECNEQNGMHINEDHFIVETIDPDTLEPLPLGEKGELVFTSITKEAFPLLRYRTKDICVINTETCSCGRTHIRMSKPMGRSDDMLIIKGVNVFPSQIESVLIEQGYQPNYQIIVDRVNNSDTCEVKVEMPAEQFTGELTGLNRMERKLSDAIKTMLGIKVKVKLVAPRSIARSEGKAVRVIDNRKI